MILEHNSRNPWQGLYDFVRNWQVDLNTTKACGETWPSLLSNYVRLMYFRWLAVLSSELTGFLLWSWMCREYISGYANDYTLQVVLGYCVIYIFMQTFMIPGTIFFSLLAGALFGVTGGLVLVICSATAGASSCFFLSKMVGRPIAYWLWPEKLQFFSAEVGLPVPLFLIWLSLSVGKQSNVTVLCGIYSSSYLFVIELK